MKKKNSTVFLQKHFKEDFTRETSYKIHGRRLVEFLDGFTQSERGKIKVLEAENKILQSANIDNVNLLKQKVSKISILRSVIDKKNAKLTEPAMREADFILGYRRMRTFAVLFGVLFVGALASLLMYIL